ncbi:sulfotransferase domain-containing protein [Caenispirillum salinarum]|uniref:sulfotransferase domain-containing protein n=1 Tax=Caenispirillum salinarum TaxID=859058 RepID=UPI00384BFE47
MLVSNLRTIRDRLLKARPDFLVIGTQKAGTTSLFHYLQAHPDIRPCRHRKELHFFDLYYDRGLDWYLSHFPYRHQRNGKLWFEATPDYLCHAEVTADRIRRDLAPLKLVVVLRNPVERAFSAWKMWHGFLDVPEQRHRADPRPFARAIAQEMAAPDKASTRPFYYLAHGRYAQQLTHYYKQFDRKDILVLDHADMERDLHGLLGHLCRFLGLAPLPRPVTEGLGRTRYWASPARTATAEDREALQRLAAYYGPHDEALRLLLGRTFSWMTPAPTASNASLTRAPTNTPPPPDAISSSGAFGLTTHEKGLQ